MSEIERLAERLARMEPAIAALQAYAQKTNDIRVGTRLSPIVVAVLQAIREPCDGMEAAMWNAVEAPVPDADSDGTTGRVWKAGIDYLLAE